MYYHSFDKNTMQKMSGCEINWMTLKLGYVDYKLLSEKDVINYAVEWCLRNQISEGTEFDLCSLYEWEEELLEEYLNKLSAEFDEETEVKKYIAIELSDLLNKLPEDFLYALLEISDFWLSLDNPSFSPHIIQSVGNTISPYEYYTEENYNEMIRRNKAWIKEQLNKVI